MVLLKLEEEMISHCRLLTLKLNARQLTVMLHVSTHTSYDVSLNRTEFSLNKRVPVVRQKYFGVPHPKK